MIENGEILIREITPLDYTQLLKFFQENDVPEQTRQFHPFPLNQETARFIACESHQDRYYLAQSGAQIVGLCMLRGWDEGYPIPSFGILISRTFQRRGLGKQMTEFAITAARDLGCRQIRLSVYESNTTALYLYRSLGFEEIERQSVTIMGQPDEKIIMLKIL